MARLATAALSPGGQRYHFICVAHDDVNDKNHPYPHAPSDTLPLAISTPFKYARLPVQPLDQRTVVMIVQKEGGEAWGEENPCHETLLVVRRQPGDHRYREVASYWLGKEKGLQGNEWFLVDSLAINDDLTLTIKWWQASRYGLARGDYVSTFRVEGDSIVCLSSEAVANAN